jgi:hypothetical protein|tara:strand:- start:6422 stop:6823 length:402 start_codon:yes stop_codon:yes gene_type:complete
VFGSNEAGRHGLGAALEAVNSHGARYGQGVGLQGYSYAIPTKDGQLKILPLDSVRKYVEEFIIFATEHPELTFNVTAIGCGLARPKWQTRKERIADISSMFSKCVLLPNVNLPKEFGGTRSINVDHNGEEICL